MTSLEPSEVHTFQHLPSSTKTTNTDEKVEATTSTVTVIYAPVSGVENIRNNNIAANTISQEAVTHLYTKRYFILGIFVLLSASNALQWIEYSIIAHIITKYYNVSFGDVDWTSIIFMLSYMILVFPGTYVVIFFLNFKFIINITSQSVFLNFTLKMIKFNILFL